MHKQKPDENKFSRTLMMLILGKVKKRCCVPGRQTYAGWLLGRWTTSPLWEQTSFVSPKLGSSVLEPDLLFFANTKNRLSFFCFVIKFPVKYNFTDNLTLHYERNKSKKKWNLDLNRTQSVKKSVSCFSALLKLPELGLRWETPVLPIPPWQRRQGSESSRKPSPTRPVGWLKRWFYFVFAFPENNQTGAVLSVCGDENSTVTRRDQDHLCRILPRLKMQHKSISL